MGNFPPFLKIMSNPFVTRLHIKAKTIEELHKLQIATNLHQDMQTQFDYQIEKIGGIWYAFFDADVKIYKPVGDNGIKQEQN
jgi:hypothetical protein